MTLTVIKLNEISYYLASSLYDLDPAFFGKVIRRSDILKRINISIGDYIYCYEKENKK
jgi:hypothetical protein